MFEVTCDISIRIKVLPVNSNNLADLMDKGSWCTDNLSVNKFDLRPSIGLAKFNNENDAFYFWVVWG